MSSNRTSQASNGERALRLIEIFAHRDGCLSVEQIAAIEKVSAQTVIREIKRGRLPDSEAHPKRIPVAAYRRYRRDQQGRQR